MITGEQVRAARMLLDWSLMKLASCSGVSDVTIQRFESGQRDRPGYPPNIDAIQRALEAGGIEFSREPPIVRLRTGK